MAGFVVLLVFSDGITELEPHALPKIAPAQFIDELAALIAVTNPPKHGITHLRQAQHPMADVGR